MINNPFNDPALASGYESWYETEGRAADLAEQKALRAMLAVPSGAQSALEIGAGTGHFSRWLASLHWRVTGVDLAMPMLVEAARHDELPFLGATAEALPFQDAAFDWSFLITSLEFMPAPAQALREAARVARQGIVLGVLNRWSVMAWQRKRSGLPLWQAAHFYTPSELTGLAREAIGARAVKVDWRTTLLPQPFAQGLSRLPFGAFIAMRVELAPPGVT